MTILICPDSFKGALSSRGAAAAMAVGARRVFPDARLVLVPLADGGEGTASVLRGALGGVERDLTVLGPLGEPVESSWVLLPDGTAVIELARAAGLSLVPENRRAPGDATTFGVGQFLADALDAPDVARLIVALGGSATNDGGAGLLQALGAKLTDGAGDELAPGGDSLATLASFSPPDARSPKPVTIAVDVDNPLLGPRGASAVFGPQKGASPEDVARLDAALGRFAARARLADFPGAGAAGGAAFGLKLAFPHAKLRPGIEIVLDAVGFDELLQGADLVLTGEGRIDSQTLGGKAVAGVAARARKLGVPVAAIVGSIGPDIDAAALESAGIDAVIPLAPGPCTLDDSLRNAAVWIADATERALRWAKIGAATG